jgi:hypothetical protein
MSRLTLSPEALGAVQQFRAFYRELFAVKECIGAQRWDELSTSPQTTPGSPLTSSFACP